MPSLYERLLGVHATRPKIPVDTFQSILGEFGRVRLTQAQAIAAVSQVSSDETGPVGLDALEQTEANDLIATITGNTQVKLARAAEIRDVLLLAEERVSQYDTPAEVRTRLGVPTR